MTKYTLFGMALAAGLMQPAAALAEQLPFVPGEELRFAMRGRGHGRLLT